MTARPARPPITPPTIAPMWLVGDGNGVFVGADGNEVVFEDGKLVVWNSFWRSRESRVLFGLFGRSAHYFYGHTNELVLLRGIILYNWI